MLADFPFFYSEVYTSKQVVHKGGTTLNVTPQNNDVKYSIWYFLTRSRRFCAIVYMPVHKIWRVSTYMCILYNVFNQAPNAELKRLLQCACM